MPLYTFQHYNQAGVGNGFDFAAAEADAQAMVQAESQMLWQGSQSVEVYEGDTLVGTLVRPANQGSTWRGDLVARMARLCAGPPQASA